MRYARGDNSRHVRSELAEDLPVRGDVRGSYSQGGKAADMPIEQPSIEVVVNLRTSREIGVSIPQSILVRAERILE